MARRVLVIDDKQRITKLLEIILEHSGYEVQTFTDPRAALTALEVDPVEIVLCDIEMPFMSGFDFCSELRARPTTRGIPLIFVTSKEEREGGLTGHMVGADAYIEKPFDQQVLLTKMEELIERGPHR